MLTVKQIKEQATTPKKALELSIKHWWENYLLKKAKLEILSDDVVRADMCGLCEFYDHPYADAYSMSRSCECCVKSGCKVRPTCCAKRSLYKKAEHAVSLFEQTHSEANYQAWRKAAKAMHTYLCSLRGKIK